ncbi:MAG TPA: hypothetical protein VFC35_06555 [Gemmatimonadaceae bacterium]|nr:hypothetical protein [Gemmatimonadaceae bacterium]
MKIILFGGTGMVGQGVLRECLLDPDVEKVLSIGRSRLKQVDAKIEEIIQRNLFDLSNLESRLVGYDACFFTLGVSAFGMAEADYTHLTYDLTLSIATMLARINPAMTFIYVSGAGTNSSESGRAMWARVKGRTENALLKLPFRKAYMFRPGFIQPLHGITSKTGWYRAIYAVLAPLSPLLNRFPGYVTTTEQVGRAMLAVAKKGYPKRVLESADVNATG